MYLPNIKKKKFRSLNFSTMSAAAVILCNRGKDRTDRELETDTGRSFSKSAGRGRCKSSAQIEAVSTRSTSKQEDESNQIETESKWTT